MESPYLYSGEQYDEETGLIYLRARYYDPETGRFISRDPVRGTLDNPLSQNPYQYALDNPLVYSDPSGEFVPALLLLGWAVAELGLSAYDIYSTARIVSDECATAEDKSLALVLAAAGIVGPGAGYGSADDIAKFLGKKIKQVQPRGWALESIEQTINNPYTTRQATNKANNNPATAYYNKDGSYVVRDNITGNIVQISDRTDSLWKPDSSIINPYSP